MCMNCISKSPTKLDNNEHLSNSLFTVSHEFKNDCARCFWPGCLRRPHSRPQPPELTGAASAGCTEERSPGWRAGAHSSLREAWVSSHVGFSRMLECPEDLVRDLIANSMCQEPWNTVMSLHQF